MPLCNPAPHPLLFFTRIQQTTVRLLWRDTERNGGIVGLPDVPHTLHRKSHYPELSVAQRRKEEDTDGNSGGDTSPYLY